MYNFIVVCSVVAVVASDTLYFRPRPAGSSSEEAAIDNVVTANGVMCPDGRSECSIGQTCCQLKSGAYGCCPYSRAVCCKDRVHCCPEKSKCDLRRRRCVRGREERPLVKHIPARINTDAMGLDKEIDLTKVLYHLNEDKLIIGNFESIKDELMKEKNELKDNKILLTENINEPVEIHKEENRLKLKEHQQTETSDDQDMSKSQGDSDERKNIVCPGGTFQCPDGSTCCQLSSGQYGCCPLRKAVCCSDHIHCCPSGTTCDVKMGRCTKGEESIPWLEKQLAVATTPPVRVTNVICPGGQSKCPDRSTCCKTASGEYGCCPLPKAVCCSDHIHCCPSGTTCDVKMGRCTKGEESIPWLEKQLAVATTPPVRVTNVICPGGQSKCPDRSTCCKTASGEYGCCPLPKAVCCSDHIHCCPSGTTCDVKMGRCNKGEESMPWLEKQLAVATTPPVRETNVICPGSQSKCPDRSTCCKMASGQYGCCPLPKAVCCSDHLHCCPSGTTCDVAEGKCNRGLESVPWFEKQPAEPVSEGIIKCPDGQSQCPDGSTCCKMDSGQYGCCPMPKAVCCSDHIHCCPSGTTCDLSQGSCNKGEDRIPWQKKQPALPRESMGSVICPDRQSKCPDGETCCKLFSGQYGCCPLPKAVCCSDNLHCCPHGTTCNVQEEKCVKAYSGMRWYENRPSLPVDAVNPDNEADVTCPDKETKCAEKSTCCKMSSGNYGCCPLQEAVCCSDDLHCCPKGSTCDVKGGNCKMGYHTEPWVEKVPPKTTATPDKENLVCPKDHFLCTGATTGCCPMYGKTVCCSDDLHCCPLGSTCDVKGGNCRMGHHTVPWVTKLPLERKPVADNTSPSCPKDHFPCSGATAGCCPNYGSTICCSDDLHCCPAGSVCDLKGGKCVMGHQTVPWVTKMPLLNQPDTNGKTIVCPDGKYECPDGSTCCKLTSGQYGCCPFPKALCCSDGRHCCPEGSTCDEKAGSCVKKEVNQPWAEKMAAVPIP